MTGGSPEPRSTIARADATQEGAGMLGVTRASASASASEGSGSGERVGDPAGASGIGAGAPATPGRGQPSPSPGGAFFFVPPQARGAPEVTDGTGRR